MVTKDDLLSELYQKSIRFGGKEKGYFAAECFIIVIIDKINAEESIEANSQLALLKNLLNEFGDINILREKLLALWNEGKGVTFADDVYMRKLLSKALMHEANMESKSATAAYLLSEILREPNEKLRSAISATKFNSGNLTEDEFEILMEDEEDWEELELPLEEAKAPCETSEEEKKLAAKKQMTKLVNETKKIRSELKKIVFGQDKAIEVFASGYFQSGMLSLTDKTRIRPKATFLFAGPPGVGKTLLAENVASILGLPFKRFDMSEYKNHEAAIEFCGSDNVYKNSSSGNFTDYVSKNPTSVILFDEIEKAHLNIINLFLQILDAGRIRDSKTDEEISLKNNILIFTTNAGKQLYLENESDDLSSLSRKVIINALQNDLDPITKNPFFPGAICSRFAAGNVVMFNRIGVENLTVIAKKEILRHATNLENETGIKTEFEDDIFSAMLFAEGAKADARTIRGRSETFFNDEIYELFRLISSEKVDGSIEEIEKVSVKLNLENATDEISNLFRKADKAKVLVVSAKETADTLKEKFPEFEICVAENCKKAVEIYKKKLPDFALLDVGFGVQADEDALNIEDADTPACQFFEFLKDNGASLPIYLLSGTPRALSDEEKVSFFRRGVRGEVDISLGEELKALLMTISANIHRHECLGKLARANKLLTFETMQSLSEDGKTAYIELFDFETTTAVDSEDKGSILSELSKPNVRFDDIIGAKEAKEELAYFINYLKNPAKYIGTGVKPPRGILLYGPPGTGKTMLAKAMACESDVTYLSTEGNAFLKGYVGEGPQAVHKIFATARKYAPSILFIDEIDAIAKERTGGNNNGGVEATLTAFLAEMDGFKNDPTKPVFVLAATNFNVKPGSPKSLDEALMRRFDRRVYIGLPGREDRIKFMKNKIKKNPALKLSDKLIDNIALRSTGMSLANLDSAIELALRSAIRAGSAVVTDEIFEEAFETFNNGEVKKWNDDLLLRTARHEAGHAFLNWYCGETPTYVTIVARGNHGGYAMRSDNEGKALYTKDELLALIRASLGGRVSELMYYGERDGVSTGPSGDLANATGLAQQMVCIYGMDEDFGLAVDNGIYENKMSPEVRKSVNKILNEQMAETLKILTENRAKLDALVDKLIEKNFLTGDEILAILEDK